MNSKIPAWITSQIITYMLTEPRCCYGKLIVTYWIIKFENSACGESIMRSYIVCMRLHSYMQCINNSEGSMVAQYLVLSPHRKKVLVKCLDWSGDISVWSLHALLFIQVLRFPLTVQKHVLYHSRGHQHNARGHLVTYRNHLSCQQDMF